MVTKDRVGAAAVIVAAIIGLVLVLTTHKADADDDDSPGPPGSASQVQGPGQDRAPTLAPAHPAPPAQSPKKDDDD